MSDHRGARLVLDALPPAIIHLIAMARRAGIPLELDDLDRIGRTTPVIANIRPSGTQYLMEDFFYAGGLRALMKQLGPKLDPTAITATGRPLVEGLDTVKIWNEDVIRPLSNPVYHEGSLTSPPPTDAPTSGISQRSWPCDKSASS